MLTCRSAQDGQRCIHHGVAELCPLGFEGGDAGCELLLLGRHGDQEYQGLRALPRSPTGKLLRRRLREFAIPGLR